jgi:hypothetical protein
MRDNSIGGNFNRILSQHKGQRSTSPEKELDVYAHRQIPIPSLGN